MVEFKAVRYGEPVIFFRLPDLLNGRTIFFGIVAAACGWETSPESKLTLGELIIRKSFKYCLASIRSLSSEFLIAEAFREDDILP